MAYGGGECVVSQNASVDSVEVSIVQHYGGTQQHYYHSEQVLLFINILISLKSKIFVFGKCFLAKTAINSCDSSHHYI